MFFTSALQHKAHLKVIWRVATINRQWDEKLFKKIDIVAICDDIINAEPPLSLQIQGTLANGVWKAYAEKLDIFQADLMRLMVELGNSTATATEAEAANEEQPIQGTREMNLDNIGEAFYHGSQGDDLHQVDNNAITLPEPTCRTMGTEDPLGLTNRIDVSLNEAEELVSLADGLGSHDKAVGMDSTGSMDHTGYHTDFSSCSSWHGDQETNQHVDGNEAMDRENDNTFTRHVSPLHQHGNEAMDRENDNPFTRHVSPLHQHGRESHVQLQQDHTVFQHEDEAEGGRQMRRRVTTKRIVFDSKTIFNRMGGDKNRVSRRPKKKCISDSRSPERLPPDKSTPFESAAIGPNEHVNSHLEHAGNDMPCFGSEDQGYNADFSTGHIDQHVNEDETMEDIESSLHAEHQNRNEAMDHENDNPFNRHVFPLHQHGRESHEQLQQDHTIFQHEDKAKGGRQMRKRAAKKNIVFDAKTMFNRTGGDKNRVSKRPKKSSVMAVRLPRDKSTPCESDASAASGQNEHVNSPVEQADNEMSSFGSEDQHYYMDFSEPVIGTGDDTEHLQMEDYLRQAVKDRENELMIDTLCEQLRMTFVNDKQKDVQLDNFMGPSTRTEAAKRFYMITVLANGRYINVRQTFDEKAFLSGGPNLN